ncbi:hypothetical protein CHS0354_009658 [Potamilus streckersoni]|uniref:RING-CH-type domain-containing protein n=1 Tax=Potamilus streckersoni TaxID=2493646 RepID=A0AAE0VNQ4_9BIVA|nr:hypothetical protein CHS0354_009658 [Potamilus streckersoni]
MDRNGEEEMKFTIKQMKSKETPDSTVANHDFFCPSQQIREVEKTIVKENCSTKRDDLQDEVTETIPFQNSFPGDVYQCKYCTEEAKVKDTLISPCRCSGSLGYVHKHCLETYTTSPSQVFALDT